MAEYVHVDDIVDVVKVSQSPFVRSVAGPKDPSRCCFNRRS